MSYIPDCRKDEFYNQKYLGNDDKKYIEGYDWCAEEVVDNFFDNLEDTFGHDSYIMHVLNDEIVEDKHEEYDWTYTFGGTEEHREVRTYADLIRARLIDWIEGERDELITSMIDAMPNEEYDANKERVDGRVEERNGQEVGENGAEGSEGL